MLLTIGDGLVAQIPSLLLSTATAIMVTRVNSSEDMNRQVLSQMFDSPRAMAVAAFILFVMGVVPGMPHVPFLSLAIVCGLLAYYIHFKHQQVEVVEEGGFSQRNSGVPKSSGSPAGAGQVPSASLPAPDRPASQEPTEVSWDDVTPVDIIGLEVGYRLIPLVDKNQSGELLGRIKGVRKKLSQEMGFLIPAVHIRDNLDLLPSAYRITLMGVTVGEGEVYPDRYMAINPGQVFGRLDGTKTRDPAFGLEAVWVDESHRDQAQTLGYTVVDAATVAATHLNQIIQQHIHELIGHEDVQKWLDLLAEKSPKLVEELVPNTISINQLLKVLQSLLREHVPIRDMRTIAEALAAHGNKNMDTNTLTAAARASLARQIVQSIVGQDANLPVITLDPALEQLLLQSVQQAQKSGADDGALLEPQLAERLNNALVSAAKNQEAAGKPIVLLVAVPLRSMMAQFVRFNIPQMRVLAYNEVSDNKALSIDASVGGEVLGN